MRGTKKLVLIGMLMALSFVGSYIKIPSPLQSIALDSMPAFLAGLLLGGRSGALVGGIAHFLTALNAGFPLSLPIHLMVGVMMALTIWIYAIVYKKSNIYVAAVIGTVLNAVGAPLLMAILPQYGWGFFIGIVPFLSVASFLNIVLGSLIYIAIEKAGVFKKGMNIHEK